MIPGLDFAQLMTLLGPAAGQTGVMGSPAVGAPAPAAPTPFVPTAAPPALPQPSLSPDAGKTANLAKPGLDGIAWAPEGEKAVGPAPKAPNMAALAPVLEASMKPKAPMPAPSAPGITPGRGIDPALFANSGAAGGTGLRLPGIDLRARLQGLLGRGG